MIKRFFIVGLIISFIALVIGCAPTPWGDLVELKEVDLIVLSIDSIGTENYSWQYWLAIPLWFWETEVGFTIANIGTADAGPFKVQVMSDSMPFYHVLDSDSIKDLVRDKDPQMGITSFSGLAAGDTTYRKIVFGAAGSDCQDPDCHVLVTVDSDNEVIESNEENNDLWEVSSNL